MTTKYKPILCLDFDGVIHRYDKKWKGAEIIEDGPVDGAFEMIYEYMEHFKVHIYSTRSNAGRGIDAMVQWFAYHGFERLDELYFPMEKSPALLTIDDRAFCFEGTFPSVEWIKKFKPWNKK